MAFFQEKIWKFAVAILKRKTTVYNYVAETVAVLFGAGNENRTRNLTLAKLCVTTSTMPA
ncbi:hypothetical protein CCP3SC1AL1_620015 [Gammaproteobacteria bacterium]